MTVYIIQVAGDIIGVYRSLEKAQEVRLEHIKEWGSSVAVRFFERNITD